MHSGKPQVPLDISCKGLGGGDDGFWSKHINVFNYHKVSFSQVAQRGEDKPKGASLIIEVGRLHLDVHSHSK